MNPKDIARLITEDPDIFNEDWEELGIEDPFAIDEDEIKKKWTAALMDAMGQEWASILNENDKEQILADQDKFVEILKYAKEVAEKRYPQYTVDEYLRNAAISVVAFQVNMRTPKKAPPETPPETKYTVFLSDPEMMLELTTNPQNWKNYIAIIKRELGDGPYYWQQFDSDTGMLYNGLYAYPVPDEHVLEYYDVWWMYVNIIEKITDPEEIANTIPAMGDYNLGGIVVFKNMNDLLTRWEPLSL